MEGILTEFAYSSKLAWFVLWTEHEQSDFDLAVDSVMSVGPGMNSASPVGFWGCLCQWVPFRLRMGA